MDTKSAHWNKMWHDAYDYVRVNTMILSAAEVQTRNVRGSVAELGVYRGDTAIVINELFPDKTCYLFDTFEGFHEKDVGTETAKGYSSADQDFSNTNEGLVLSRMKYPHQCVIRKGWFPDTTKGLETEEFCFVSIDADLYDPIYAGLTYFYPRLNRGGMIFIHDFNNVFYGGVREAVESYCKEQKIGYVCIPDMCGSVVITK